MIRGGIALHRGLSRSHAMGKKNAVPDRWENYVPVGKRVKGTRFISFKVPLRQAILDHLEAEVTQMSPLGLLENISRQNESLGLVIDLTNTTRYYDPKELTKAGIKYEKIFTMGHEVPNDKTIAHFKETIKTFIGENGENDKLIGVHCTHGVNRTGYLVCRYLIDCEKMEPDEAIQAFNSARGHSIERENYLKDLKTRDYARHSSAASCPAQASSSVFHPSHSGQEKTASRKTLTRLDHRNDQRARVYQRPPSRRFHQMPPQDTRMDWWSQTPAVGGYQQDYFHHPEGGYVQNYSQSFNYQPFWQMQPPIPFHQQRFQAQSFDQQDERLWWQWAENQQ
ncbi:RNA/RNP complex-1-interacting phosphatase isoform X2 [Petromyzon marinus]|nr:RNA/RNP complex-1-interacting phosphatase isoform X3 [Petromyzon marinus]